MTDISVVLATYNGSRFLEEQLASIAGQTLAPIEVLLFDDGSAPDELAATRAIAARFPGVVLIEGANVGITANFARGIARARGTYVALADQDDVWTPGHLAVLRAGIGDADLVYGDMLFMDEEGHVSAERFSDRIRTIGMTSRNPKMFEALLHGTIVWGAASLFRRGLVDGRPFPDTRRYHDWWLSVLALLGRGICYTDQVVAHHRIHAANASHHQEARGMMGEARREHRRRQGAAMLACLDAIVELSPALAGRQHRALAGAIAYHKSLVADRHRVSRTIYAWRHRRLMVPDRDAARQAAIALSKLL